MLHSVRDSFTESQLKAVGINNVINTGCPTMWNLTPEHCKSISAVKSNAVVFTLTDYNQDLTSDLKLISALKYLYQDVYFWPQGSGDISYFESLPIDVVREVKVLSPHLHSLNAILVSGNIDYVGTRLHAGIRALQRKVRSLIIGIDNRAIEKSKDFGLPVLSRTDIDRLREGANKSLMLDHKPHLASGMRFSMSHQLTFADSEFNGKRRKTRKEIFLARMDALLPWSRMLEVIEPVYPKAGNGRRPYPLDTMLRTHCMQQWYNPGQDYETPRF